MDIQNNNVTLQIQAKDLTGRKLRVADCDIFLLHVYTQDPSFYLTYTGREMLMTECVDEITIPKKDMEHLKSGVVQYTYHYLLKNQKEKQSDHNEKAGIANCPHFHNPHIPAHRPNDYIDDDLINSKPVVTQFYWRNLNEHKHPNSPHHPVNGMNEIERVHRLLDIEITNRVKDINTLDKKINEEIERSTKEDKKLVKLIDKKIFELQENLNDNFDKNIEEVDNKISEINKTIEEEISRATKAEADIDIRLQKEESYRIGADDVLEAKIQMEKERAITNESNLTDRISSISEKFESYNTTLTEGLQTEVNRSKQAEKEINDKIQGVVNDLQTEISRSSQKDIEHTELVNNEKSRAESVENKISTELEIETNRAKDAEKHILDEVHELGDNTYNRIEVDNIVSGVTTQLNTLQNQFEDTKTNVSELSTKVSGLVADIDKAKADILTEVAKCDAENNKLATNIKTLSESTYTKTETDAFVNNLNSSISSLENWKSNQIDNTEGLNERVSNLITTTEKLSNDLNNETTARINSDLILQTKIDTVEGKIDAEAERAKSSEELIKSEVAEIRENATINHNELYDSISETNANLTLEVARAKAQEKLNADAIEIINGDVTTNGSIKKSLQDSKDYTDAEIAKLTLLKDAEISNTLKSYATNEAVDKKINDIIGTAPEALDTLGKISNVLSQDNNAISAINEVLKGKANSEDIYTKAEIDTKVSSIDNTIATLETNVNNADATINGRIDDLANKVKANETSYNSTVETLQTTIDNEVTRAKADEKKITDMLESELSKVDTKYNELNAKVIQDIADSTAKDTEIDSNISALNSHLTNVENKIDNEIIRSADKDNELVSKDIELEGKISANSLAIDTEINRAKQVETELNDKINLINISEINSTLSALNDNINAEKAERETVDKINADAIERINGDKDTIGSISHALEDAKHYTDDELAKINIPKMEDYYTKNEISVAIEYSLNSYYTKKEIRDNYFTKEEVIELIKSFLDVDTENKTLNVNI